MTYYIGEEFKQEVKTHQQQLEKEAEIERQYLVYLENECNKVHAMYRELNEYKRRSFYKRDRDYYQDRMNNLNY